LRQLLNRPSSSTYVLAEAHGLLGEIEFSAGCYRTARTHFAAVIRLRALDAETCLRYGDAVDADPDADPRRGWAARRRATRIDSFDSRCWTALGRSGLRIGDRRRALLAFRRAARLRPERIETLTELVEGFIALGRIREARAVVNAARFRQPHDAAIAGLWARFRFDCAHREQQGGRDESRVIHAAILPFIGPLPDTDCREVTPTIIRTDRRSRPMPHVLRLPDVQSGPRWAN
jgi:tetratricopeptide (TPR) repeat protein